MLHKQQINQYLGIYKKNFTSDEKRLDINTCYYSKILSDTDFLKVVQGPTKYNKTNYLYIRTSWKIRLSQS